MNQQVQLQTFALRLCMRFIIFWKLHFSDACGGLFLKNKYSL